LNEKRSFIAWGDEGEASMEIRQRKRNGNADKEENKRLCRKGSPPRKESASSSFGIDVRRGMRCGVLLRGMPIQNNLKARERN